MQTAEWNNELGKMVVRDMTAEEITVREAELASVTPDINALKAAKNEQVNAWREEANAKTFPYAGKEIAVDDLSWKDILSTAGEIALFGAFPENFPGGWKATDNTYVPLPTVDDFKTMFRAMTKRGADNFNHAQALKAQLAAASTPEEVAAIEW